MKNSAAERSLEPQSKRKSKCTEPSEGEGERGEEGREGRREMGMERVEETVSESYSASPSYS